MPRYLVEARYSPEGWRGVIKGGGGTPRVEAVRELIDSVGGTVESFYFGFGGPSAYIVIDVPDNVSVAVLTMTVQASGAFTAVETVVLLTPDELDEAARRALKYSPPGA